MELKNASERSYKSKYLVLPEVRENDFEKIFCCKSANRNLCIYETRIPVLLVSWIPDGLKQPGYVLGQYSRKHVYASGNTRDTWAKSWEQKSGEPCSAHGSE
jgi:hypothetical protein